GEAPPQTGNRRGPPGAEGCQDHLGVGAGAEAETAALQLGAELPVVVDLAVEGDPVALARVRHRLRAPSDVDDREAPMHQRDTRLEEDTLAVGAPVSHQLAGAAGPAAPRPHPRGTALTPDAPHLS